MRSVRLAGRAFHLPWREAQLALRGVALLGAANLAVKLLPFAKTIALGSVAVRPGRTDPATVVSECVTAIRRASYAVPWRTVCIHQGLALQLLLRRRGVPAILCYGTNHVGGELKSHVWVKVENEIVIGGEEAPAYHLVAAYPREPAARA